MLFVRYRKTELNYVLEARLKRKSFSSVWITYCCCDDFVTFWAQKVNIKFFFPKTFLRRWLVLFLVLQYTIFLSICKLCAGIFSRSVYEYLICFSQKFMQFLPMLLLHLLEKISKKNFCIFLCILFKYCIFSWYQF